MASSYALYKATLLCLDALICLLAGFIGALVLGIFQLSFSSTLAEWERFKAEQVDEPMDSNGQLTVRVRGRKILEEKID
jgi:hypothetical protein